MVSWLESFLNKPIPIDPNSVGGRIALRALKAGEESGKLLSHGAAGFTRASTLGLIQTPTAPPQTPLEKVVHGVGFGVGVLNPISPITKLWGTLGRGGQTLTSGLVSKVAPGATGAIARTVLPAVGAELAQTGAFTAGQIATGREPTPISNLALGLGLRGVTGLAPRLVPGAVTQGIFGRAKEVDINLREIDALRDAWRVANKTDKPRLLEMIRNSADRNLSPQLRDRLINNPTGLIKEIQKNLTSQRPQFQPTVLGFAEKTPPSISALPPPSKSAITKPQLRVAGTGSINEFVRKTISDNPTDPIATNYNQRLFRNIADAIQQKRINVEDLPWFKIKGYTNDQYLEVADLVRQVSTFSGQTLNQLSQTAKFISRRLPDVIPKDQQKFSLGDLFNRAINLQGAALVSNVYTAARNALVGGIKLPMQALDDALAGGVEAATGKATVRQAFAPLYEDFASVFRAFSSRAGQKLSSLISRDPLLKERLLGSPVAEVTLGSRVANALTTFNKFQDNFFTKIRFDALIRSELTRRGLKDMSELPPDILNRVVKDALKFTFRGYPETQFMKNVFRWTNNPVMKLGLIRFPRFMALATEHLFDYSPAGFFKLFSPSFQKQLISRNPRQAFQALAQASTGTMLLGAGIALRSSEAAGDKWYQIKTPDGKVLDARPFFPLSSYLFLGEVAKGADARLDGRDYLEGALSINRVQGTGLVLLDVVRSRTPNETLKKIASQFVGEFLGGFTVPLRQFSLAAAPFSPGEAVARTVKEQPLIAPTIQNIPGLRQMLPELPSITRKEPLKTERPLLRLFTGLNVSTKTFLENEMGRLNIPTFDVLPKTGNPKIDRLITKETGPIMERLGKVLEKNPTYQSYTDAQKEELIRTIFSETKKIAKGRVMIGQADEIVSEIRKSFKGKGKEERIKILLKWKNKGLLTEPVIEALKKPSYVNTYND